MANEIIRPSELPVRTNPVPSEVVPSDNNVTVAGVSWEDGVNSAVPPASQSESEAGVINSKRMTPLTTKQAIDAQVPPKISAAIGALNLSSASQAQVSDFATAAQGAKADSAVQPSNPALLPAGGSTSQVLIKSTNADYDTKWETSAAATAVSYAPQVLTDEQKLQAQSNLSLANFKTVPLLLADTSMSYTADPGEIQVGSGDVVEAGGFRYEVAASGETSPMVVETTGGVKNLPLPAMFSRGRYFADQTGIFAGPEHKTRNEERFNEVFGNLAADGGVLEFGPGDYYLGKQSHTFHDIPARRTRGIVGAAADGTSLTFENDPGTKVLGITPYEATPRDLLFKGVTFLEAGEGKTFDCFGFYNDEDPGRAFAESVIEDVRVRGFRRGFDAHSWMSRIIRFRATRCHQPLSIVGGTSTLLSHVWLSTGNDYGLMVGCRMNDNGEFMAPGAGMPPGLWYSSWDNIAIEKGTGYTGAAIIIGRPMGLSITGLGVEQQDGPVFHWPALLGETDQLRADPVRLIVNSAHVKGMNNTTSPIMLLGRHSVSTQFNDILATMGNNPLFGFEGSMDSGQPLGVHLNNLSVARDKIVNLMGEYTDISVDGEYYGQRTNFSPSILPITGNGRRFKRYKTTITVRGDQQLRIAIAGTRNSGNSLFGSVKIFPRRGSSTADAVIGEVQFATPYPRGADDLAVRRSFTNDSNFHIENVDSAKNLIGDQTARDLQIHFSGPAAASDIDYFFEVDVYVDAENSNFNEPCYTVYKHVP